MTPQYTRCTCSDCKRPSYTPFAVVGDKPRCRHCASKFLHPRWPRGKYNGQRIVGVTFEFKIDVTLWFWRPVIGQFGAFHWLCFLTWTEWTYEQ